MDITVTPRTYTLANLSSTQFEVIHAALLASERLESIHSPVARNLLEHMNKVVNDLRSGN